MHGMFLVAATTESLTVIRRPRQCSVDATICAIVLSRMRSLAQMHVSGAMNVQTKDVEAETLDYVVSHHSFTVFPKSKTRSMLTSTHLLVLLPASFI
jgi:hypothetical protein